MTFKTRRRRTFSGTAALVLVLATLMVLPATAEDLEEGPLELHPGQQDILHGTAGDAVEAGYSNEVEGCGELADGEVGWAFLVAGNADTNYFSTFEITFSDGTQTIANATRVREQKGHKTLLAFATDDDATFESYSVEGVQKDGIFQLTHVCVPDEPEGSILIEKSYEVEPGSISEFTVYDDLGATVGTMTATTVDADTVLFCLDELSFGDYVVSETVTPDGFVPADDINVTVDTESTCAERLLDPDPDATITNPTAPQDLEVQKLKLSHDGTDVVETTTPLAGFEYTLYEGADDTGTVVESSTTDATGFTSFTEGILEVGDEYTVCETGVPTGEEGYWTSPSDHGYNDCETFTVQLDQDESFTFYNAPRADIDFGFTDVTGYASLNIICVDANGVEVINETFTGSDSVDALGLDLGDYSCDIEIRNGSAA